jgi:predicted MPP superfamily phosphohydrolase
MRRYSPMHQHEPWSPAGEHQPNKLTRRNFLAGVGVAAAALAGVGLYANEVSRHELDVTEHDFFLRNLPPAFEGFRVVQFSDIHLDEYMENFFLEEVVDRVNRLNADLVLVTGDFVSRGPMPLSVSLAAAGRCGEILKKLVCPQRFGILGNHDAMVGSSFVRNHMQANNLPLLVNENVRIERGGQHILLAGLDDVSQGSPDLGRAVPAAVDCPVLLMCHEPDYADVIAQHPRGAKVDLIYSGHTHGGQVRLPGLPAMELPPHGKIYVEGHFVVGKSQLYVNRGVGTVGLPFRLNCPPEITVGTLRRAPESRA